VWLHVLDNIIMAFLSINNVRIAGFASGVPKNVVNNLDLKGYEDAKYSVDDFVRSTGVERRRRSDKLTTSDLCFEASESLLADLDWNRKEIDAIVFVSQTPDYIYPATACILQNRLGLSKECYAQDISLGCSGWVYGLSTVAALISSGEMKKALLLSGDAKGVVPGDSPLFGHAGTVTALEYVQGATGFKFHFGTDGSGYDAIIVPDGGCRNGITQKSFEDVEMFGMKSTRIQGYMKGMDVFAFGMTTAPKSVRQLSEHYGFDYSGYDWFVFHQANLSMNNLIAKMLKLEPKKVPVSLSEFGNTSSASIPLTITTQLQDKASHKKFICCGFGVGLSWGTVAFETDDIVISKLVELEDKEDSKWV